ncbi:MAG: GPR endopeptidase [Clostridiales bacterium]|nr:GPR endopeptidase [Clostridiales bacterium]
MIKKRTDLAAEARELWRESAGETTELSGVEARTSSESGFAVETVKILDERGEAALGKPKGTYISIDLDPLMKREEGAFARAAAVVADKLRGLLKLKEGESVLVCGLGNSAITPDNIGPGAVKNTLATRHLVAAMPEDFAAFRPVAVLEAGVLGTTGVESAEIVRAVAEKVAPAAVIAVDALASRRMARICRTLQISDTGIVPGSGVGNARSELSENTLGVPVISVGVPTVVDAGTLAADLMEQAGIGESSSADFAQFGGSMVVTPREIDSQVDECARLIGYGINMALHELTVEDIAMLV